MPRLPQYVKQHGTMSYACYRYHMAEPTVYVSLRIPESDLKRISDYKDALSRTTGIDTSRTDAMLSLLRAGLAAKERVSKKRR